MDIDISRGLDLLNCSELDFYYYYFNYNNDLFDSNETILEERLNILEEKYFTYLDKLEEQKDSCSLYKLGIIYSVIIGDYDKAVEYFQKCIKLNNSWGYMGMYENTQNNEFLDKAVELNNPIALRKKAEERGVGIEKSMEYYERAADSGDYESMINYFNENIDNIDNIEKALKYRHILHRQNNSEKLLEIDNRYDKYLQIVEAKLFKSEDENKKLKEEIENLKLELSLIPEYGELYKESKKDFEEHKYSSIDFLKQL